MTIVQLSITEEIGALTNIEPFVYKAYPGTYSCLATFTSILGFSFPDVDDPVTIIDFFRAPGTRYAQKVSYADCVAQEASWYFDSVNQILYFHVEHDQGIDSTFLQGTGFMYGTERMVNIGGFPCLPFVKSVPDLSQQQDIVDYDIPSMVSGDIEFDNTAIVTSAGLAGPFDELIDTDIYGNRINIYYLEDSPDIDDYEDSDLEQISALSVDDYDFEVASATIHVKDLREEGNVEVPTDLFSTDDYPDIKESLINKPIPWLYGSPREIPLICTNGETTSGNVNYRAAITMTDFGTVYVDNDDVWTEVTPVSSDLSTGELILAEADARDGEKPMDAKLVGCSGIKNDHSSEVIVDLNNRALDMSFDSSEYDLGEWAEEELSLGPVALYLGKQEKLYEVIADIQNGSNVGFRYSITATGKRTITIDDETRVPVTHISNTDILDRDVLKVETDSSTLAAIVNVDYDKSYEEDEYYRYVDESVLETVYTKYKQKPSITLETLLTTEELAAERSAYYLDRFSTIRGVSECTLMGAEYLSLRIYDIATIEITPSDFVDVHSNLITGRQYFGIKSIKILSVDPDTENRQNTITGVIIGDAIFPENRIIEYDGGEDVWLFDDGDNWQFY